MIRFKSFSRFINLLKSKGYQENFLPGEFDNPESYITGNYAWNFSKDNVLIKVYSGRAVFSLLKTCTLCDKRTPKHKLHNANLCDECHSDFRDCFDIK